MTDPQIVGNPPNQATLYDIYTAISALDPNAGGDVAVVNSSTPGKTTLATTNSILTAVEDQVTHYLAVKDIILNACEDQQTHYLGTKDVGLNAIIAASKLAVTDATLDACIAANKVATADANLSGCITGNVVAVSGSVTATNAVLTAVEDTIAHTLGVQVKGVRTAAASCVAHRASLTAPDLVGAVATAPTAPTVADSGLTEGNLTHAPTTWYAGYVVRNGMGVTMASAIGSVSLSAAHSIRITIPAAWGSSLSDTDLTYEIFLSTDSGAPKHVATFTGAQLAAGAGATARCWATTAESPQVSGSGGAAWACDIGVTGANVQTTANQFAQSTALSQASIAALTTVSTTGYNNCDVFVDAIQTAYTTTSPSLTLVPVFLNDKQGTNYHVGAPIYVNLLNGTGQSFRQVFNLTTNGASVMILVANIANVTVNRIDVTPTSMV